MPRSWCLRGTHAHTLFDSIHNMSQRCVRFIYTYTYIYVYSYYIYIHIIATERCVRCIVISLISKIMSSPDTLIETSPHEPDFAITSWVP